MIPEFHVPIIVHTSTSSTDKIFVFGFEKEFYDSRHYLSTNFDFFLSVDHFKLNDLKVKVIKREGHHSFNRTPRLVLICEELSFLNENPSKVFNLLKKNRYFLRIVGENYHSTTYGGGLKPL